MNYVGKKEYWSSLNLDISTKKQRFAIEIQCLKVNSIKHNNTFRARKWEWQKERERNRYKFYLYLSSISMFFMNFKIYKIFINKRNVFELTRLLISIISQSR